VIGSEGIYNGRSVGITRPIPFATTFIDLSCRMEMWVRAHLISCTIICRGSSLSASRSTTSALPFQLQECFLSRSSGGGGDQKHSSPVEQRDHSMNWHSIRFPRSLALTPYRCVAAARSFKLTHRNGLEPWQKLRTEERLHAHLDGISPSRNWPLRASFVAPFVRCFRRSFDTSVHQR